MFFFPLRSFHCFTASLLHCFTQSSTKRGGGQQMRITPCIPNHSTKSSELVLTISSIPRVHHRYQYHSSSSLLRSLPHPPPPLPPPL
ncbi:hypothetical protein B0J11DRAFT_47956 [Dendryphion nanum]|uniref:Secreted protein n=1 Tax=Dendryphion nanum TaxID=256645 RepID=A0A9P9DK68_9PLEO|nr:hypothetical protein B0J11DRAFT_47956 [Dendryphion nanum]